MATIKEAFEAGWDAARLSFDVGDGFRNERRAEHWAEFEKGLQPEPKSELRQCMEAIDEPKPGSLAYAEKLHGSMTAKKPNETPVEKARREAYAGVGDDGIPCD